MSKDHFDKWAENYDDSIKPFLARFPFDGYYNVLAEIQRLVEPADGMKILDVGIGTGLLSRKLAQGGCKIFGVDFSPKMIEHVRKKIPDGEFCVADITKNHLGIFNGIKYDWVISSYWFHHLDTDQKLDFIKRIIAENLAKSGKIIIGDIGYATGEQMKQGREDNIEDWDNSEFYMCGEELINLFRDNQITAQYRQISSCAGILLIEI